MYVEFLLALVIYMKALNAAAGSLDESDGMTPYVDQVPVLLENELCGFIADEIGGTYSFRQPTLAERDWWEERPWRRNV